MSSVDHGNENESAAVPAEITGEGSVGSDNDIGALPESESVSKNDGPNNYQHHARSNSVKKPTTFKAVSVTKNFLAKAGAPPAPTPKINGEIAPATTNGGSPAAPILRPRLVAKSSGTKQAKGQFGAKTGSGPDPMQVWNRNRGKCDFTPQHPLKHLTDEELKQQYGIHLATRIQGDGDGKEAKWADIDDDEDDWAPEAIEWNDGTKINLPQKDSATLLAEQQAAEEAAKKREEEEKKAKAASAAAEKKPTTTVGPNATVLKPRSLQAKPGSPLVLKNPAEKPTLVSKPASTTPAKSPWAPLPAIDKVPPVEINPPVQVPGPRLQPNGLVQTPAAETPSQPALEIAADSFKRGGPEAQKETVGQLYNDKSGKYEPAAAGRRGSMRKDGGFRAPAVLQRGGNAPDAATLIESHRLSHDGAGQDSARRPSAVSTEGGAHGRRQSMNKGSDAFANRRGSQHSQSTQSPSSMIAQLSTPDASSQDGRSSGAYRAGPGQTAHPTAEREDVVLQKQLMKEKREQAIKRRQEQEAREEAEKQERIRKKLESLPPVSDKKEAQAPTVTIEKRPSEMGPIKKGSFEKSEQVERSAAALKSPPASPLKHPKSPPKPPVPNASGEPMQYGMMKLHAPVHKDGRQHSHDLPINEGGKLPGLTQKHALASPSAAPDKVEVSESRQHVDDIRRAESDHKARIERENILRSRQNHRVSGSELDPSTGQDAGSISPFVNGSLTPNKADHLFSRSPELTGQRPSGDVKQQPWNDGNRESRAYPSWGSQQPTRESASVWGAPPQSRPFAIAFDRTIQRPQSGHQEAYQASPALAPIGPPKANGQTKDTRGAPTQISSPAPGFENSQTVPSYPPNGRLPLDPRAAPNGLLNGGHKLSSPQLSSDGQIARQNLPPRGKVPDALSAWQDFPTTVGPREAEEARLALLEHQARRAEEARNGSQTVPQFKEKWKQIETTEGSFDRKRVGVVESLHQFNPAAAPPPHAEIRGPSFVNATDIPSSMPPGFPGRTSRFFPVGGTGRIPPYGHGYGYHSLFPRRGSSPPPPDSNFHPAHHTLGGEIVVRLPFDDRPPKPKVKLPPAAVTPVQSPQPPPAQLSLRPTSKPLVNLESWQERFNNMLGTKKLPSDLSPEKRVSQISSATKEPLAIPSSVENPEAVAAVTLPPPGSSRTLEVDASSREFNDEDALFEPAPGSMPQVHFPKSFGVSRPWIDKGLTRQVNKELPPSRNIDPSTRNELVPALIFNTQNMLIVFINLFGMANSRSVPVRPPPGLAAPPPPRPAQQPPSNSATAGEKYHQKGRQQHGRPYKPRETSELYAQSPKSGPTAGPRGVAGGARGGIHRNAYGHRGGHMKQNAVAT